MFLTWPSGALYSGGMRPLLSLTVLASALLSACAPSAGGPSAAQDPAVPTLIRQGDTFMLEGRDQNDNAMSGRIELVGSPRYRSSSDSWSFDGLDGYVILGSQNGGTSHFWDTSDPKRHKACIVFDGVAKDGPGGVKVLRTPVTGVGISGSEEELNAVFAKLRGSGQKLVGGACTVTRS